MIDLTRQSGIIPQHRLDETSVTIVGAGSIGSNTAKILAQMGISTLVVYDDDTVEAHNLANQGYGIPDIGQMKVEALFRELFVKYQIGIERHPCKYTGQKLTTDVVISAVDNMAGRKLLIESCKRDNVACFIDARMGAEIGHIYTLYKGDTSKYEKDCLFSDEDAMPVPCTEKATSFCASGMAGLIAGQVKEYVVRDKDVPGKSVGVALSMVDVSQSMRLI